MAPEDGPAPGRPGAARTPAAALSRLRRPRLYEQLADHITAFIEAQGLSPGERLPPERLLAEQLGVSRATLAQALVALEVRGVVDVRHGEGAVLREASAASQLDAALAAHGPDERDLADARAAVLGAVAALAAEQAGPEQRAALAGALEGAGSQGVRATAAALVVEAAGSPTLARLALALAPGEDPFGPGLEGVLRAVVAADPVAARRAAAAVEVEPDAPAVSPSPDVPGRRG
ncbi:hypothetical protein GCM10009756_26760 [Pseudokineococcus marinus]|uniref:FadR/GntR family transcriptional regulator n=1 Tax=Pseudokineococcus marinus TaxID=351215 RepID=UPI0031D60F67